ncbi:MAG: hypothetical protein HOQ24_04690 [Mycobacteriaceae bacterium]|nr:hypothetical protein [Mycobacteriaceae bacterium]
MADADFAHTDHATRSRHEKATQLARYIWDRGITGAELLALPLTLRRKLARAAGANPPSTEETWILVADLLSRKSAWAAAHPDHPAARPADADEKILWVKPPVTPF